MMHIVNIGPKKKISFKIDITVLIEHFENFKTEMQWDSSYLLHLGIDGPKCQLSVPEATAKSFCNRRLILY